VTSNVKRGTRVSAARAFLRPARRRANLTVLTHAVADRITFDGTVATGLEVTSRGKSLRVHARREVLVCGGGLESPLLLERSGIGNPEVLAAAGVPLVAASPKVGENLREHRTFSFQLRLAGTVGYDHQVNSPVKQAWTGFKYLFSRRGVISFGGYNIVGIYKSDAASPYPDTQAFFTPLSITGSITSGRPVVDRFSGAMFLCYPLYPTSTGSIHITGPKASDTPRIVPNYLTSEHDRAITLRTVAKAREILATEPFARLVEAETVPAVELRDDADVRDYALNNGGIGYHGLGTCAIGPDDDDVVDDRLRVRGTSNLRVVDASIFPAMPGGNNNAPTQAMAWIAADLILQDAR
jgi:choline dehydrogenase